jgi:hypothetical protein
VPIPQPVVEVPGRVSPATMVLVFNAKDLPPLGFRSYYINRSNHIHRTRQQKMYPGKDITLGNSVSYTAKRLFFFFLVKDKNIIVEVKTVVEELDNPDFELKTTEDSSLRLVFWIMTPFFFYSYHHFRGNCHLRLLQDIFLP